MRQVQKIHWENRGSYTSSLHHKSMSFVTVEVTVDYLTLNNTADWAVATTEYTWSWPQHFGGESGSFSNLGVHILKH